MAKYELQPGANIPVRRGGAIGGGAVAVVPGGDASSVGGYVVSELGRLAENCTITGVWDFDARPTGYGPLHDMLAATHSDTLAGSVVDGDVIIGNVTPKWSRLAIAVPAANVRNVLGIDNGETRPSWKTALDATNPANIANAANPGTSLVFSHRDHVHAHAAGLTATLHHNPVTAGAGIAVSTQVVSVNLGYAFTWTAKHIFRSTTTPQVEIGYDAAAYMSVSQANGGDVTLATVSDGTGNMILAPAGDVIVNPTGNDVLPQTNYDINLGTMLKKYLTLWVAELNVGTLVARETMAIFGGRALIGPSTTTLTDDRTAENTSWPVKHNGMRKGDIAYLEASGKVEFIEISGWDFIDVSPVNDWFKITGDLTSYFVDGVTFTIDGSTANDGEWTTSASSVVNGDTQIEVDEDITDGTVDGHILYRNSGPYIYWVIRDKDGSGANVWYAGDAVFNTGATGDGFIDIYSVRGIKAGTEYGPTIVGNVRNSATYNDWTPHWAVGELNGVYGYGATTYGAAFGKYEDDWLTIENTNGIRIYANNILVGQWQTNADLILGQVATDKANLFWDQSEGRLNFRGGTDGVAVMAYVDTDGSIYAAEGELVLNDNGIATVGGPTLGPSRQYKIVESVGGNVIAYFGARQTPNGTNLQHAEIKVYAKADYQSRIHLEVLSPSSDLAEIRLHSDSGGLDAYLWIRSTFGGSREMILELDAIALTLDKTTDLAAADAAFDDAYADDWNNVADFYAMDRRRREDDGRIVPVDDLAILRGITASGVFDERTGLELIDDSTLPEWLLTRAKEAVDGKREVLRDSQGKPYVSVRMFLSVLMGVARQTDARVSALEQPRIS